MFIGKKLNPMDTIHAIKGAHEEILRVQLPIIEATSDRQATKWIAPEVGES